jgi:hypothetical protein
MGLDEKGEIDYLMFPMKETQDIIEAMEKAEKENDAGALKWCARRMLFLHEASDVTGGDDTFYPMRIFDKEWKRQLKDDPPPESISPIIIATDKKPYEVDDHGELALEFKEPPELNSRADAMYLIDKLIEADRTENESIALEALRDAINKGVLNQ